MIRQRVIIFFCFVFILATDISYAAGIIYRVQQAKAMKRQQAQQVQQAEYQQQHQQQEGGQPHNQQAAPPTYQQTIDQRNQDIAKAIRSANNSSASNENVPFGNSAQINDVQQITSPGLVPANQPEVSQQQVPSVGLSSDVKDVVDLSEVWKKLDKKSTVWTLLIDDQSKVLTISEYIDRFQKQGVKISAPPTHYVQMIDQIVGSNPQMLQRPFGELLQIAAIVDYDFDNGMNKDDLARKVLGEEGFEANKKRFNQ